MLPESIKPLNLKYRILYSGSPAADGITEFIIPTNSNRHSLIIMINGAATVRIGQFTVAIAATVLSTLNTGIFEWDKWGDALSLIDRITGIAAITSMQVIETVLYDRELSQ